MLLEIGANPFIPEYRSAFYQIIKENKGKYFQTHALHLKLMGIIRFLA